MQIVPELVVEVGEVPGVRAELVMVTDGEERHVQDVAQHRREDGRDRSVAADEHGQPADPVPQPDGQRGRRDRRGAERQPKQRLGGDQERGQ